MAHVPRGPGCGARASASAGRSSSSSCCRSPRSSRPPASRSTSAGCTWSAGSSRTPPTPPRSPPRTPSSGATRTPTRAATPWRSWRRTSRPRRTASPRRCRPPPAPRSTRAAMRATRRISSTASSSTGATSGSPSATRIGYTFGRAVGLTVTADGRSRTGGAPNGDAPADRGPALHQRAGPHDGRDVRPCDGDTNDFHGPLRDGEHRVPRHREQRLAAHRALAGPRVRLVQPEQRSGTPRPDHRASSARARRRRTRRASGGSSPSTSATSSRPRRTCSTTASPPARTRTRSRTFEAGWVATGYPGPAFPPVTLAARPGRPGRDHRRQLVGDHRRRGQRAVRAGRGGPRGRLLRHGHDDPRLRARRCPRRSRSARPRTRNNAITMTASKNSSFSGTVTP